MGSQYYHDPAIYRSRSPYRGHSPPTPSRRQYSPAPPPIPRRHYSPFREPRSRSPQRNFSPQNETRFSDRSRPSRTLPWQSQSLDPAISPRRQEYYERDRYHESSPRTNSRRPYDYPNSREETYYTQPQYPSSHGQSSPAFRPERTPPSVADLETWPSHYATPSHNQNSSPYYPQNSSRERENNRRRNDSLRGSRDSPICVEDFQESPNWKRNRRDTRRRNVRESGAERLIHDERRPLLPARDRSPRSSWGQQATPVQIDISNSPPQVRRSPNDARAEVGLEDKAASLGQLGQHWVHPDRRGSLTVDQPAPTLAPPVAPPPRLQKNDNVQIDPPITPLQKSPYMTEQLVIRESAPEDRRQSSLERSLQERAVAEKDMQLRLKQTEEERRRAEKALAQATIDADLAEKNARERQSFVQILEARQRQASAHHVPGRRTQSHSITPPQLQKDRLISNHETSYQETFEMQLSPTTKDPISSIIPAPLNGDQIRKDPISSEQRAQFNEDIRGSKKSRFIKAKKFKQRARVAESHSHKSPTASASLTSLTTGEKHQLLNQMAKYSAEMLFARKGQSTVPPQAASSFGHPPGLLLIQTPSGTPIDQQIAPTISTSKQRNPGGTIVPQDQAASSVSRPILTVGTEKAALQANDELSALTTFNAPLTGGPLRKRRLSIASSCSSLNSRLSNSPFLSSALTSGACIVCLGKDIPSANRLAQCAECSSLYHQSCHSPPLTKAILEEAGGNWICRNCKQKHGSSDVGNMSALTKRLGPSKLSVTLKRANYDDEKALEEKVMTNKSCFSSLLLKHAAWKAPPGLPSTAVKTEAVDAPARKASTASASLSTDVDGLSVPESQFSESVTAKDVGVQETFPLGKTDNSEASTSITPLSRSKSISKSPQPAIRDLALGEVTFQEVSLGEAVPSVKPPDKAIPASQSPDLSQHSPDVMILEPTSPPVSRPRGHRKRELVISDSEEEFSSKRGKTVIPPRAAMKSASGTWPPLSTPAPLKLPPMSGSFVKTPKLARKSAAVARKSGYKPRQSESRESTEMKGKEMSEEELRSPISPIQSVRPFLQQLSPIISMRPTDPGASQQYSLRLILSTGASKNDPELVIDNGHSGFDHSTPYPDSLNRAVQPRRLIPPSRLKKHSRENNNFNILSLVPDDAVAVIEDGKLAFREGAVDARTGQLKRGARKFKVGRVIPGELL